MDCTAEHFLSPSKSPTTVTDPLSSLIQLQSEIYGKGIRTMGVRDLLQFIAKLQQCRQHKGRVDLATRHLRVSSDCVDSTFDQPTEDLVAAYCNHVRYQVREWFCKSSWERRGEIIPRSQLHLGTNDPEDIMFEMQMQMAVATEHLPPNYCCAVMMTILEELEHMQSRIKSYLVPSSESILIERVCAIINDSACLFERFDNICLSNDFLGGNILPSYTLKKKKDQITAQFLHLANSATGTLAQLILRDLKPVLSKLWEDDDHIQTIISTFRDYFKDLRLWIAPIFFAKCIRHCLENLLQSYIDRFSTKKHILNVNTAVEVLEKDRLNLLQFFGCEHSTEMKQAGLSKLSDVENKLHILQVLQSTIRSRR